MSCPRAFLSLNLKVITIFLSQVRSPDLRYSWEYLRSLQVWVLCISGPKFLFFIKVFLYWGFEQQNLNLLAMLLHAPLFFSHSIYRGLFPPISLLQKANTSLPGVWDGSPVLTACLPWAPQVVHLPAVFESMNQTADRVYSAWSGRLSGDCCCRL